MSRKLFVGNLPFSAGESELQNLFGQAGAIESVRVPVITMAQLLAKHPQITNVMGLQIDTEGHDYTVVRSAVGAGCLPRIINYEHKHLSYSDQVACRNLLETHGYAFWTNASDTLAYRLQEPTAEKS